MKAKRKDRSFKFFFPMSNPHSGAPLGNGVFGALIWGDDVLEITVSRNDFWDHRNGQRLKGELSYRKLTEAWSRGDDEECKRLMRTSIGDADGDLSKISSSIIPLGRFELAFGSGIKPSSMELDIRSGRLDVLFSGSAGKLTLRLSPCEDLLTLEDPARLVSRVAPRPSWDLTEGELKARGFPAPVEIKGKGRAGWTQVNPGGVAAAALCSGIGSERLLIATATGDADEAAGKASGLIALAETDGERLRRKDLQWWRAYWKGLPELEIPEPFFARFFPFALYKFACATNPHGEKPAPLQGPWVEDHRLPPWAGSYTINVNIQQIYTPALWTGKLDHMKPLFELLASPSFQEIMRGNAKTLLGIDDGLLPTHCINDLGFHCQNGFSAHSSIDPSGASWLAWLHWLHYRHSGDVGFLRDRAYPFMHGVMRVYEEMLEERDGRLSLPLGPSPEYGVSGSIKFRSDGRYLQEGRDPSAQLAAIHMLADVLQKASSVLGLEPRPIWQDIQRRLPPYCLTEDGKRIALWEGQDLEVCHRHHSHLNGLYPFDTLCDWEAKGRRIIDDTIDRWIEKGMGDWSEWGMPWAASIQAKLGFAEAPVVTLSVWKEIFVNDALATVYIPKFRGSCAHRKELIESDRAKTEIMQLDGTMACASALCEMMIHERSGVIRLFKGIPAKWRDAAFHGVHVPGGFVVDARREAGRIVQVQVRAAQGGTLRLEIDGRIENIDFMPGELKDLSSRFSSLPE